MVKPEDVQTGPAGSSGATGLPHLQRLWNEEQGNAHTLIVGLPGAPKTTSILSLLFRLAAPEQPTPVVDSTPVGTPAARQEGV